MLICRHTHLLNKRSAAEYSSAVRAFHLAQLQSKLLLVKQVEQQDTFDMEMRQLLRLTKEGEVCQCQQIKEQKPEEFACSIKLWVDAPCCADVLCPKPVDVLSAAQ